jgi:parvulin-like peptidyl-prolyl isomerase
MKKILERLKQGEDFNQLANEVAREHGEALNGDVGRFEESQLEPSLVKRLRELPDGGITEPLIRPNGVQIVKLVKREKTDLKSFDDVRNAIHSMFYKKEVEKRYMAWIKELRKHAYTKIIF